MALKFFIDNRIVECPDCHALIQPHGPFKTIAYDSDGIARKTGICPMCGCEAVI